MLTRRAVLTGGVAAGTVSSVAPGAAAAGSEQSRGSSADTDERVVRILEDIRDQMRLDSGANVPALERIRDLQRDFLKGHGKFPDFIDVGAEVWDSVLNWHVRTRQVAQVQRTAEGRYAVAVFQTNLILRHDVANGYIGQPYDPK